MEDSILDEKKEGSFLFDVKEYLEENQSKKITHYNPIRQKNKKDSTALYQTPEIMTIKLLKNESFFGKITDPFCGEGAIISTILDFVEKENTEIKEVNGSDIRSKPESIIEDNILLDYMAYEKDFFTIEKDSIDNLITNPPWGMFSKILPHAKKVTKNKIAMLLPLQFLTGKERYKLLKDCNFPLVQIYVFNRLLNLSSVLREDGLINVGNIAGAWFVWENINVDKVKPVIELIDIDSYVYRKGKGKNNG